MLVNEVIGTSKNFQTVLSEMRTVAPVECSVLIQGETGTGKEVFAHAIHDFSPRRNKPFIALNCAAVPASLLESELFGHERGAFTGAIGQTTGRFQAANAGTLFLDEIGDLPLELQPKLLRVLQQQQFERLGSTRTIQVDVRLVAATNQNLQRMVEEGRFRADLYYRLSVFPINLPPLRERQEDMPLLARHFVRKCSAKFGKNIDLISDEVMQILTSYHWPGNIRELQNFIERAVIVTTGTVLSPRAADLAVLTQKDAAPSFGTLREAQRAHIIGALRETNWMIGGHGGAAVRLGMPRTTLIGVMHRLGISREAVELREDPQQSVEAPAHYGNSLASSNGIPSGRYMEDYLYEHSTLPFGTTQ